MLLPALHSLFDGLAHPGNTPPAHIVHLSDQAARSHATITNGKLENERALFSAAAAFLGMICSFRRLENRAGDAGTPQRSLEGFG